MAAPKGNQNRSIAELSRQRQEEFRQKVQVGVLADRLNKHVLGEIEMTATQVSAAKILIDKAVSNAPLDVNNNTTLSGTLHTKVEVHVIDPKG